MSVFTPEESFTSLTHRLETNLFDSNLWTQLIASLTLDDEYAEKRMYFVIEKIRLNSQVVFSIPHDIQKKLPERSRKIYNDSQRLAERIVARGSIKRYPSYLWEYQDISAFCEAHLTDRAKKFIPNSARFCTIGSCFALNLGESLKTLGYFVNTFEIGELVNNPVSNLWLLENVIDSPKANEDLWARLQPDFYERSKDLKTTLKNSDVLIYTLGLGLAFFNPDNTVFAEPIYSYNREHYGHLTQKPLSQELATEYLKKYIEKVRSINPDITIFLTLSPVPLDGVFSNDYSAIEMDCISKSIGRAAIHNLVTADPSLHYFPSFEIVRWVAAQQAFPLFGGDQTDCHARHVTKGVIDAIMQHFADSFLL